MNQIIPPMPDDAPWNEIKRIQIAMARRICDRYYAGRLPEGFAWGFPLADSRGTWATQPVITREAADDLARWFAR